MAEKALEAEGCAETDVLKKPVLRHPQSPRDVERRLKESAENGSENPWRGREQKGPDTHQKVAVAGSEGAKGVKKKRLQKSR